MISSVGVPELKDYKLILTSEEERFAGSGNVPAKKTYKAEKRPWDNREYSIRYPLPSHMVSQYLNIRGFRKEAFVRMSLFCH